MKAGQLFLSDLHPKFDAETYTWKLGGGRGRNARRNDIFERAALNAAALGAPMRERTAGAVADIRRFTPSTVKGKAKLRPATIADDLLERLLGRVADGDVEAFAELYEQVSGRLFAITHRILRDHQAAEDALQEAMLRTWRVAGRYDRERGAPLSWLAVIARNVALDLLRVRRPSEGLTAVDTIEMADAMPDPPDAKLHRCLAMLPPDQAKAIITMYTYGLSHAELAEHLSVPLGTAKSWVRRGMETLKECMGVE